MSHTRTHYQPAAVARVSTPTPRTYPCDQLGICDCMGAPCTSCSPQPPSTLERASIAALKLLTLTVAAGAAGWVWGTYARPLKQLCWSFLSFIS